MLNGSCVPLTNLKVILTFIKDMACPSGWRLKNIVNIHHFFKINLPDDNDYILIGQEIESSAIWGTILVKQLLDLYVCVKVLSYSCRE